MNAVNAEAASVVLCAAALAGYAVFVIDTLLPYTWEWWCRHREKP